MTGTHRPTLPTSPISPICPRPTGPRPSFQTPGMVRHFCRRDMYPQQSQFPFASRRTPIPFFIPTTATNIFRLPQPCIINTPGTQRSWCPGQKRHLSLGRKLHLSMTTLLLLISKTFFPAYPLLRRDRPPVTCRISPLEQFLQLLAPMIHPWFLIHSRSPTTPSRPRLYQRRCLRKKKGVEPA